MSKDAYYTPQWLAEALIAASSKRRANVVADFAAGDGALLRVAQNRWKDATILASDLCETSVRKLRRKHKDWHCVKCDFLNKQSRDRSNSLRELLGGIDQIVLNPPFSCRGGAVFTVDSPHGQVKCGRALAFVIASLEFLRPRGELVALLPSNVLSSQKDSNAIEYLKENFNLKCNTAYSLSNRDFQGCSVRYLLMTLFSREKAVVKFRIKLKRKPIGLQKTLRIRIVRGTSQMHDLPEVGRTLVHTTDMRDHRVELNGHCGHPGRPSIIGPAVLLPRVGAPRIDKACLYLRKKRVVLSDCVIGLQCNSADDARGLLFALNDNRDMYESMFSGTCAPYLTVKRLTDLVQKLGCVIEE